MSRPSSIASTTLTGVTAGLIVASFLVANITPAISKSERPGWRSTTIVCYGWPWTYEQHESGLPANNPTVYLSNPYTRALLYNFALGSIATISMIAAMARLRRAYDGPVQFSIRFLLAVTTGVALMASLLRGRDINWIFLIYIAIAIAIISIPVVIAALADDSNRRAARYREILFIYRKDRTDRNLPVKLRTLRWSRWN
jgi:hypothetical protein